MSHIVTSSTLSTRRRRRCKRHSTRSLSNVNIQPLTLHFPYYHVADLISKNPAFTKALTCLSKYGDELFISATQDYLSLSATNSSKSAYCRVKYATPFFSRYSVGDTHRFNRDEQEDPEAEGSMVQVTGQLLTKVRHSRSKFECECEYTIFHIIISRCYPSWSTGQ